MIFRRFTCSYAETQRTRGDFENLWKSLSCPSDIPTRVPVIDYPARTPPATESANLSLHCRIYCRSRLNGLLK